MESITRPGARPAATRHDAGDHPAGVGDRLAAAQADAARWLKRVEALQARYRAGELHVHLPPRFSDPQRRLDELLASDLPASQGELEAASDGLFYSLPVAFDPAESVGPYLATVDRDPDGEPYRFLDLGA